MNRAVVRRTTAGIARHLLEAVPDAASRGVVVARDARHGSSAFEQEAVATLTAHGVRVHHFDEPVPTPLAVAAVTALGAAAGVVVTASHNPPGDNGMKVVVRRCPDRTAGRRGDRPGGRGRRGCRAAGGHGGRTGGDLGGATGDHRVRIRGPMRLDGDGPAPCRLRVATTAPTASPATSSTALAAAGHDDVHTVAHSAVLTRTS